MSDESNRPALLPGAAVVSLVAVVACVAGGDARASRLPAAQWRNR
jgi:hypothetical protein